MNWDEIVGQQKLSALLKESIADQRVSHAQLFVGKEGYGVLPLVLAYVKEVFEKENPEAAAKVEHLNHVDVHFSFPTYTEKNNSYSRRFYREFRTMILENPYADFEDWSKVLESENKQLFISADETSEIGNQFSLKSFEGGTKVLIIWRADKMNNAATNKFLKFLEEPPEKTLIFLTAEKTDTMLPTILSRTQMVEVPRINDDDLLNRLQNRFPEEPRLSEIVHEAQGNYNNALKLLAIGNLSSEFEELFVEWVRSAFMVAKNPALLKSIIKWAIEIASWQKEKQRHFLEFAAETFRLALMQNYVGPELVYRNLNVNKFNWDKFSNFIHGANIESILEEISQADYHLERNANSKIVWTDLGIKLTRYLHRKVK